MTEKNASLRLAESRQINRYYMALRCKLTRVRNTAYDI